MIKKIKAIDIQLRRKAHSVFSGMYRSAIKGQGMIFSHVREYEPGDDIRSMAWNLTAKKSKPYIKVFEEDKQCDIILAVDISSSMNFGLSSLSKRQVVEQLSSLLAFCSLKNKDRLALLLFSSEIELYLPPKKGEKAMFRVIKEVCAFKSKNKKTDVNKAFEFLHKVLKQRAFIFLFSDFLGTKPFKQALKRLGQKHEVLNLIISDPWERSIPRLGLLEVQDLETGRQKTLDLSFAYKKLSQSLKQQVQQREKLFLKSSSEPLMIPCEEDPYNVLFQFFKKRSKMIS